MAKVGSLTVDLTLKSAEFIRDLGKTSKAVAANTSAMRKSFEAVRQSATALVGSLSGLASLVVIRRMARLTEESLKLAASMDGPLTSAAQNFLAEGEKVSNAFQLGVAQGFLESFNAELFSSEENLRNINELGSSLGQVMATMFALALDAAKPFAEIVGQIAAGLQYIATHTPGQALRDALDSIVGPAEGSVEVESMTAVVGSGVTAWDAYSQAVKRTGEEIANTAKVINVAFPDVAKMQEEMRLQAIKTTGQWLDVADTVGKALGTMFKENKAVAIAQAVINTAQAITEALKLPFPINWAQVAAVTALGAAQIATISSAQPGSSKALAKSTGGAGAATTKAGTASKGSFSPGQTVTIKVMGDVFGPEHFRKIVAGLNDVQRDGTALIRVAA